jgi:hypothetical protein
LSVPSYSEPVGSTFQVLRFVEGCRDNASWLLAIGDLLQHRDDTPLPAEVVRVVGKIIAMEANAIDMDLDAQALAMPPRDTSHPYAAEL